MRIGLLGDLEVHDGDQVIDVPGAKQRALLVLLALHAGVVLSRDRIVEELWGDSLPDNPANALQKRVSELRKLIGTERLYRRSEGYILDVARSDVDALDFEDRLDHARRQLVDGRGEDASAELVDALGSWRGEVLSEFADLEFARAAAGRLHEARWGAIEDRVDLDLDLGRHHELTGELSTLVREQPLRERLVGQLMLALYRSGRQSEALRAFSEARERLAEELGLDPGPALRDLETAILNHDNDLAAPVIRSTTKRRTNLPAAVTSFVGREGEQAKLLEALGHHRLVTLTGPGGAGKTRLAVEVGRLLAETTTDGVWLAELAPIADGLSVAPALALAVRAHDTGGDPVPPLQRLVDHLRNRDTVVIVDNCEHVLDAVAVVASAVLASCPDIRLIATSREPLGVSGEAQLPVPPLPLEASTELFAERARAVRADFERGAEDGDIVDVCTQLDGLPLAIELAAARVKALPVAQIATRLENRFKLLSGGPRDAATRHQTLRAAVEWSHDLLFEDEKLTFRHLSIFPGSFDLPAAEAVCGRAGIPAEDVVDLIAHLVDKSLLAEDGGRYRMLETLREFGLEKLDDAADRTDASAAHAGYFIDLATEAAPHIFAPDQVEWLDLLDLEIDNLRAAVQWTSQSEPTRALETAAILAPAAWLRGHRQEIRYILEQLLAQNPKDRTLASCRALRWASHLADASGWAEQAPDMTAELALAHARSADALALATELDDPTEIAHCQRQHATTLVRLAIYAGDTAGLDEAEQLAQRSEAGFHALGDAWGEAIAVVVSMFGALGAGDLPRTAAVAQRAWPLVERAGDRFLIERILFVRALLAEVNGDPAAADLLHGEALVTSEELGFPEGIATHRTATADGSSDRESMSPDETYSMAASRSAGAHAALAAGDLDRAESLLSAALALYDATGDSKARAGVVEELAEIARRRNLGAPNLP